MLRLIQAGKLHADRGSAGAIWAAAVRRPRRREAHRQRRQPPAANRQQRHPPTRGQRAAPAACRPWRDRLHAALLEAGMQFTADAVEHSEVTESNGELQFVTPEEFCAGDERKGYSEGRAEDRRPADANQDRAGKAGRSRAAPLRQSPKDDVSERALAHPEVKRFQELFPDARSARCEI